MMQKSDVPTQQYVFRAQCTHVVDGDTVDLLIDMGMHSHRIERIRLLNINCPEMRTTEGLTAKSFTALWISQADNPHVDWPLVVQTYKTDVFGRYLASIWRVSDGANLNFDLIASGNAAPFIR